MKALSIRGLWAWAIFHLPEGQRKDIENRSWRTHKRERIAVHMSKGLPRWEYNEVRSILHSEYGVPIEAMPTYEEMPRGKILGTVFLSDCVTESDSRWFVGDYGFVLKEAQALSSPIECTGGQNFWDMPSEIVTVCER